MNRSAYERLIKIPLIFSALLALLLLFLGSTLYLYFSRHVPSVETLKNFSPPAMTRVYSDNGDIVGEFFYERRDPVSLERVPLSVIRAFLAAEDARFFSHRGIDIIAITRAFIRNLFAGEISQGGSTVTQQVVKSLLLTPEKSFSRKFREAILAYRIEKYLTKQEILGLYLNLIYLGHGAYGISQAAETYFGKAVEDLNLAEAALLAGLVQAPSRYSPVVHPELAKKRQLYVLQRMVEEGFITPSDMENALLIPIRIATKPRVEEKAPYFVEHVKRYVEEKYGKDLLYRGGLRIYTTLDLDAQKRAERAIEEGLWEIEDRHSTTLAPQSLEGALICIDLETGYVRAMVGGRSFRKSQFNRVTQARRQTGSVFKPIVYASALENGYTPASIVVDAPIVFEWANQRWKPKNFGNRFLGPITLRRALTDSVNVVTVKIARDIGTENIVSFARRLGISAPLHRDLSMALGSSCITLYELARAYAVFATQGRLFEPIFVKRILDRNGNLLEENLPICDPRATSKTKQVISPQIAYIMTSLLQSVVQRGTGWRAKALGRPVAGKTGTTDQFKDAWFIGYTPELLTGVWVGIDEGKTLGENVTGAQAACPIWVSFMSGMLHDKPARDFPIPEGIEFLRIDPDTGEPSSENDGILECFEKGKASRLGRFQPRASAANFFKLDLDSLNSR